MRPKVLAYYFPDWHTDDRNSAWFGPDWTEWKLVDAARPRFDGHRQPRVPLDGLFDEATPESAEDQIGLARRYGVDGFLVDFYWYDDGPYLARALDEGLLAAPNRNEIEFALMWANHELVDIFPYDPSTDATPPRLKDGAIGMPAFRRMARHVIAHYFTQPNYLKIDGKPWFSIYELGNFILGLGGISAAKAALEWFESEAVAAGFPGLHLDAVIWGIGVLPTAVKIDDPHELVEILPFASATSYVWVHHAETETHDFPIADVERLRTEAFAEYETYARNLSVPFHPNVTVGWDSTPRLRGGTDFTRGAYPQWSVWDQTPEQFRQGLELARDFVREHPTSHPIITINAWNEWTEGSYLLPDTTHGLAFLEAIRDTFPRELP